MTRTLLAFALSYPETIEGVACAGTVLEKHTVRARNKAFVFLGIADAMMKLGPSLPEAIELTSSVSDRYKAGAHGWVSVKFTPGSAPPLELLQHWIDESYRLVAPKQLVSSLP